MNRTFSFTREAMATDYGIIIACDKAAYARQAADAAFDELARIEQELSRFVPHSDIARLNSLALGQRVTLGPDAWTCLLLARRMWELTGGAFDVTLGTGLELIGFDGPDHAIQVRGDGVRVDLGGIGKGYAVDAIASLLRDDWRVDIAIVHAGQSTVLAWSCLAAGPQGRASSGHCWSVQLRDPRDDSRTLGQVVLNNRAFSGSGVGRHGQHIVDPRRGDKVRWPAAWALATTAAEADALSTAFMVMDAAEVERLCGHRLDVAGILLADRPGAELVVCGDVELQRQA